MSPLFFPLFSPSSTVTIGSGFKGSEVTPLFFVGAARGNTLAVLFGVPVGLFAAMGFVSVFAGATNTPLACTLMVVELFGGEYVVYFATSTTLAYLFSGHSGIYLSQRIGIPKHGPRQPQDANLQGAREAKSELQIWWRGKTSENRGPMDDFRPDEADVYAPNKGSEPNPPAGAQ